MYQENESTSKDNYCSKRNGNSICFPPITKTHLIFVNTIINYSYFSYVCIIINLEESGFNWWSDSLGRPNWRGMLPIKFNLRKEDFYRKTTKNVGLQFAHMLNSFFGPPSILYVFVSRLASWNAQYFNSEHFHHKIKKSGKQ